MKIDRKKIIIVLIVLGSAGVLSGGIYYTWLITPPSMPTTAAEGLKTISSARYKRLPEYRKQSYLQQTQQLLAKMPEQERGQLMQQAHDNPELRRSFRAIGENAMRQRVVEFASASPQDRLKLLDNIIDMQEKGGGFMGMGRGGFGPGGPGGPGGRRPGQPGASANNAQGGRPNGDHPPGPGGPGRGGRMREHIKQAVQTGNPQHGALMGEFMRALHERRAQRGLPDRHPPH